MPIPSHNPGEPRISHKHREYYDHAKTTTPVHRPQRQKSSYQPVQIHLSDQEQVEKAEKKQMTSSELGLPR